MHIDLEKLTKRWRAFNRVKIEAALAELDTVDSKRRRVCEIVYEQVLSPLLQRDAAGLPAQPTVIDRLQAKSKPVATVQPLTTISTIQRSSRHLICKTKPLPKFRLSWPFSHGTRT
jgi:hypothetical protein